MKNLKFIIAAIFSLTLLSQSCKKHNIQPQSELSKLPAATQTGANTFGCLINGQAFVPNNRSILQGPMMQCNYIYLSGGYYFTVKAGHKNSNSISGIEIDTDSLIISEGGILKLTNLSKGQSAGFYQIAGTPNYNYIYSTTSALIGELTITRFDTVKQIVSGTFYFNVLNNSGDTVKITDGRFDLLYTR